MEKLAAPKATKVLVFLRPGFAVEEDVEEDVEEEEKDEVGLMIDNAEDISLFMLMFIVGREEDWSRM